MKKFEFTSANGSYMDIPTQGKWECITVNAPITVKYTESTEEKIRLLIPEGKSGTLLLDNYDSYSLQVSCVLSDGISMNRDVTLEIHHAGLESITLSGYSLMSCFGTLALTDVMLLGRSILDLRKAEIKTNSLTAQLSNFAACQTNTLVADSVEVIQNDQATLYGFGIRCSGMFYLKAFEHTYACLQGNVDFLDTEQYDGSRVVAHALLAEDATCIVRLASVLHCNAKRVDIHASKTAVFQNHHPSAKVIPLINVAEYKPLREMSVEDALQMVDHMKPHTCFNLHIEAVPYMLYSGNMRTFKRCVRKGHTTWLNSWNNEIPYQSIKRDFEKGKTDNGTVLVDVQEGDVDWADIPKVHQRYQQSMPYLYECYLYG